MITTGEGGALIVNNKKMRERAMIMRSHGIEYNSNQRDWQYQQTEIGYNFRMSELQAALGSSQLKRLNYFVKTRNKLAKLYNQKLVKYPSQISASITFQYF